LAFSIVDVVRENPDYLDYCNEFEAPRKIVTDVENCPAFSEPSTDEREDCIANKGGIDYRYDGSGCPVSYECNTCRGVYEEARKEHRLIGFVITGIFGVLAILFGVYSKSKEEVIEWIYSGILIGGILSILFGTVSYFGDMGRFVKPIILIIELALIIFIAIKAIKKK
jgi:hypothetical protein